MLRWLKRLLGLDVVDIEEASPMVRKHQQRPVDSRIVSTPYKEPPPRPERTPPPPKKGTK